jgi:membrane peptidoglycan carboxypeptidase
MDAITAYQLTSMMEGVVKRGSGAGSTAGAGRRQDRHHQ